MKIINLGRGQGKTTRLLYASEFQNIPIVCSTHFQKEHLRDMAKKLRLKIPEPIVAHELISSKDKAIDEDLLIDEAPLVLEALLKRLGVIGEIKAITLTSDELNMDFKR
jgi:hypothetical protein